MAAKFELKHGGSGQFVFNLKARNGEVILKLGDQTQRSPISNSGKIDTAPATENRFIPILELPENFPLP